MLAAELTFLTPEGFLLALGALVAFGGLALNERRARRARAALGLPEPGLRERLPSAVALVLVPGLLAVALAQPVLRLTVTNRVRTDAEAFYVLDVSRSMLASRGPEGRPRFERAQDAADRIHTALRDVPAGVASMTDRVVPHLFPTANDEVFTGTLEQSMRIGSPPPAGYDRQGTHFAALDTLAGTNFFDPGVERRLAVVLTDGESREFDVASLREVLADGPPTRFVIVRFWHEDERVWGGSVPERDYSADPLSERRTAELARATGGEAFEEDELDEAIRAARAAVGRGPVVERGETLDVISLGRWFALAALVPLGFLLWRRNLV